MFPDATRKALTAEFTKLVRLADPDASNARKPVNLAQFKYAIIKLIPDAAVHFNEFELLTVFDYMDQGETGSVSLFEFTKAIRGKLSPYRALLVDFVFQKLDAKKDQKIDESELLDYFGSSADPGILSGLIQPRFKAASALKDFGAYKNVISRDQFEDFYISRSLQTENDARFKKDILTEWLIADVEAENYLYQATTGTVKPSKMTNRRQSTGKAVAATATDDKADIHNEMLMARFRKFFPDLSRNSLTAEFKMLSAAVFDEKKTMPGVSARRASVAAAAVSSRPVGFAEFKFGLTVVKPELLNAFTEKELSGIFNHMDQGGTSRVTLFEFVMAVRGTLSPFRYAVVEYAFECLDSQGEGAVDEYHLLRYFETADFPEVLDGNVSAATKVAVFIKSLGLTASKKGKGVVVKFENLVEYYISKSLVTEDDSQFRSDVCADFNLKEQNVDRFIARNYPNLAIKLSLVNRSNERRKSHHTVYAKTTTPRKQSGHGGPDPASLDEPFDSLLNRFRRFFPSPERNSLTMEFKKLMKAVESKGIKQMGLKELRYAINAVRPDMAPEFTDRDLSRLFQYFDLSGAQRITLFEFVKQMRGPMPPYRTAIVEYIFLYVDTKNDGILDQQEVLYFYANSELPDIVNGSTTPAARAFIFFKALGQQDKRMVKLDMLVDFYLTKSLQEESDLKFKKDVLVEWNLTEAEVDAFIQQKYPKLVAAMTRPTTPLPPSKDHGDKGAGPETASKTSSGAAEGEKDEADATKGADKEQYSIQRRESSRDADADGAEGKADDTPESPSPTKPAGAKPSFTSAAVRRSGPSTAADEKHAEGKAEDKGDVAAPRSVREDKESKGDGVTSIKSSSKGKAVSFTDGIDYESSPTSKKNPTAPAADASTKPRARSLADGGVRQRLSDKDGTQESSGEGGKEQPKARARSFADGDAHHSTPPRAAGKDGQDGGGSSANAALKALLASGTTSTVEQALNGVAEKVEREVADASPDELKKLVTTSLVTIKDQRKEIDKLNKKVDALIKLLIERNKL